jgi:protein-S-isoprenylcysteine O-methyltransferase Ste14
MDAQPRGVRPELGRAIGIVFGLGTQLGFLATVRGLFWYLYGQESVRPIPPSHWLLVDTMLALQFAVPHSLLLVPSVRRRLVRWVPSALYGSLFCATTCAGLWLIFLYWRTTASSLWELHGAAAIAVRAAFVASWVALFYSLSLSGFGYQTGWTQWRCWFKGEPLPRRGLVDRGAFRVLRHPAYLSFLGLIWFTPHMTLDHALLTAIWTGYIFGGSVLKDQRLLYFLRDEYREYASHVPGYPGMPFGPLARWHQTFPDTEVAAQPTAMPLAA